MCVFFSLCSVHWHLAVGKLAFNFHSKESKAVYWFLLSIFGWNGTIWYHRNIQCCHMSNNHTNNECDQSHLLDAFIVAAVIPLSKSMSIYASGVADLKPWANSFHATDSPWLEHHTQTITFFVRGILKYLQTGIDSIRAPAQTHQTQSQQGRIKRKRNQVHLNVIFNQHIDQSITHVETYTEKKPIHSYIIIHSIGECRHKMCACVFFSLSRSAVSPLVEFARFIFDVFRFATIRVFH